MVVLLFAARDDTIRLGWAVGGPCPGRLCALYVYRIYEYDDNHYSTSELPAARVHNKCRMALQLCALRVGFQPLRPFMFYVVLAFPDYDPEIANLLPLVCAVAAGHIHTYIELSAESHASR